MCSHISYIKIFYSFLQVMASKTKIYFVLELVTGGELFDKIVSFFDLLNMSFFFKSSVRTWNFVCIISQALGDWRKMRRGSTFSSLLMQWTIAIAEVFIIETLRLEPILFNSLRVLVNNVLNPVTPPSGCSPRICFWMQTGLSKFLILDWVHFLSKSE